MSYLDGEERYADHPALLSFDFDCRRRYFAPARSLDAVALEGVCARATPPRSIVKSEKILTCVR